jgi:anti-sigma factor RsiW
MDHEELQELMGAYALDAVDADERVQVEDHLRTCPRCRAEVADYREVAAYLAQSGAAAPEGLWDRIAGALEEAPPQLRLSVVPNEAAPDTPSPKGVRRWLNVRTLAVAAAIVVIAGVIGTLGFAVRDQRHRIDDLQQGRDLAAAADVAFADPSAKTAELRTEGGAIGAVAVVRPNGEGYLLARNLPVLDQRVYQLWGVTGKTAVSLGVMGRDPSVVGFTAGAAFDKLVITSETRPVVSSTNPPVVQGDLA